MHPSYRQRLIDADPTALQGISVDLQRAIDQSRSQRLETEPDNLSPEEASLRASETLLEEEYHLLQEARIDPIKRSWTGRRQKDPNSPNGYRTMSEAEYSSRRSLGEFEAEQYGQIKARETLLADARARGDQQAITRLESEIAETRKTYDDRRTILQDHINNGRWETAMSFAKSNGITEADLQNYRADYEHNAKADRDGLRQTSNNSSSGETAKLKADLGSFLRTPNGDSSDLVARLREIDHSELSETERAYYDRALDSLESQRLADPALAQELARLASNGNELVIQDSLERTLFAGKDQDPRFIKNYIEAELRPQIEAGYERLRTKLSDGSSRAEIEAEIRNLRDLMLPIATYNGSNLSQSAARGAEADQPVFTELEQNLRAADLDSLLRSRETDDTAFRNEARRYLNERDSQRPVLALEANNARDISKLEEYIDDYIEEYNDPTEDAEEIGAMLSTIDRESLSPEESASISAVLTRARDKGMNLPAIADDFIASDSSTIRQRSNHSNSDEVAIRASIHAGSRKIEVDPDYQASSHNERIATALLAEAEAALLDGTETSGLPTSDEIAILREDIELGDPEAVIEFAKTHPELGPSLVDIQVTETMRRAEQRAARNNHNLTVITDDPEVITSDSLPEGVMAQTETTVHPDGTRETRIKFAAGLEEAARRGEREALEIYLEEMNRHASATLLDPSSMSEAEYTAARAFEELGAEVEAKREAAEATGGKLGAIEDGVYKEALGRLAPAISGDPATREARSQAALDAIQTEAELRIGSEPLITEPDLQNYRADYEHNSKTGETRQTSNSTVLGKKARESMLRDLEEWGSPNGPHRTDESIRKFEAAYADGIEGTDEILKGAHEAETPGKRQGFYGEAANNDTISKAMKKYGVDPSEGIRTSLRHVEGKAQLVDHLGRAIDIPKEGDAEAMQKFNQAGYTIDGRGALFYTGGGRRRPIKDGASKGGDDKKQVFVRNGRLVNGNGDPVMIVATKREYGMSHAAREIDTAVDAELRAGDKTVRLQRYFEHKLRPATLVNKVFGMPNEPRDHGDGGAQLRSLIALSHAHGSNPSIMISAETSALYADDASSFRRFGEALATTLPMYQEAKAAGIVLPKLVVYDENMKPIMQVDASGVSLPGDKK